MLHKSFLWKTLLALGMIAHSANPAKAEPPAVAERPEYYAVVGIFDLNNDGLSDREALHEIFRSAKVVIDNEVDDQGVRKPADGKIPPRTKYLLVGTIPDPAEAANPQEREAAKRILQHYEAMQTEARKVKVRIVHLADFLTTGPPRSRRFGGPSGIGTGKTSDIYRESHRLKRGIKESRDSTTRPECADQ